MDEERIIVEQPNPPTGDGGTPMGRRPTFRHALSLLIAAAVLVVVVLGVITGYIEKWLWMRQLDYTGIFWTLLSVQWAMFSRRSPSPFCSFGSICVRLSGTALLCALPITHGDLLFFWN